MNDVIGIAGLGLIGGSFAKAIKAKTNCRVLGFDISEEVVEDAKRQNAIDGVLAEHNLKDCRFILIALYPDEVISYCKNNFANMQSGTIVVDCAGVKTRICAELSPPAKQHSIRFVGGHPMAGVEKSGFSNSFAELFESAVMILCEDKDTDHAAVEELKPFFLSLGFGNIKITTADEHDKIIAYTSQLAHLVSSAYIQSETLKKRYGFSAGSFKDLTRVAKLNEEMWTALFFENKESLIKETDIFIENIRRYRQALAYSDKVMMKELLKSGTALKIKDETEEDRWLKK